MTDVTVKELAELVGVSTVTIRSKLGSLPAKTTRLRGQNVYESAYALKQIYLGDADADALDLSQERARLAKAQANITEMQEAELRGELVRIGEVEAYWAQIFNNIKAQLIGLPRRAGHLVLGVSNLGEVENVILTEIETTLHELADFVPVPDHQSPADVEAAAAADDEPVGGSVPATEQRDKRRTRKVADKPRAVPKGADGRRGRSKH